MVSEGGRIVIANASHLRIVIDRPTQPSPTQPLSVVAVVCGVSDSDSIHRQGSNARRRSMDGGYAAGFGGASCP